MSNPRPAARRSTSNQNARGSTADRRRRKVWLLDPASGHGGDGTSAPCAFGCGTRVTLETIYIDRIVPGCYGGTYARSNIQPACGPCSNAEGGRLGPIRKGWKPDA